MPGSARPICPVQSWSKRTCGGACFDDANLADVDLSGADVTDASFRGANLTGARLDGTDMSTANLN